MYNWPSISPYYIPYIRSDVIQFFGTNLKPFSKANFFFDNVNVSTNIQIASTLKLNSAPVLTFAEGLYSSTNRGYATVIGVSGDNEVQLNENYLRLGISATGVDTLAATDFAKNDIVFQTKDNSGKYTDRVFSAFVEYWNHADGFLAVKTNFGSANTVSSRSQLFKINSNKICNVTSIIANTAFTSGTTIASTRDPLKTYQVTEYNHKSSIVTSLGANNRLLKISSNAQSVSAGSSLYLILEQGRAFRRNVVSVVDNTTLFFDVGVNGISGDTKYSIGEPTVNRFGDIAGMYTIPEIANGLKFKTGEKIFTITDGVSLSSNVGTMMSSAKYVAQGIYGWNSTGYFDNTEVAFSGGGVVVARLQTGTPTVQPLPINIINIDPNKLTPQPPILNSDRFVQYSTLSNNDPLAQTFFTPKPPSRLTGDGITATDYGTFVTSVDLYFRRKPLVSKSEPQLPVTVKIINTVNGIPGSRVLASATVSSMKVNVADGVNKLPNNQDYSTKTRFTFEDPVYLDPNTEYAIAIETDSPYYDLWIAELSQPSIIDGKRVSEQPYAGKFFRSQNASQWTPYENQDLMFTVNRAFFNSNTVAYVGGAVTLNFNVPSKFSYDYGFDSFILRSDDLSFPVAPISYSIKTTLDRTLDFDDNPITIQPNKTFDFSTTSNTSISTTGRRRTIRAGNANSFIISVTMDTKDESVSPFFNKETFNIITSTNLINNGQILDKDITIVNGGVHSNASNVIVTIGPSTLYPNDESARAKANVLSSGIVGNTIVALNVYDPGKGYVESPTITITDSSSTSNAVAVVNSEDKKYGGNGLARFVTKKITLADGFDAGDLRVFMNAVRPQGSNIVVYYKVLSASDPDRFEDKNWKRMALENDLISPDLVTAYDYVFRPSLTENDLSYVENGITYPVGGRFKYFAIKIVMFAECGCVPPRIKNLRIVALPEESKKG